MRKTAFLSACLFLACSLIAQVEQHEVSVINIEVPVRVFAGGNFVDNLTLQDFELYEDGKLQKLEALYCINKNKIERTDLQKAFIPSTGRHFYLIFQLTEYNSKINEAIAYLFEQVLLPEDMLTIMTAANIYSLTPEARQRFSREKITKELTGIIRKDTTISESQYRSMLRDLQRLVRGISGSQSTLSFDSQASVDNTMGIGMQMDRYLETLQGLENLRQLEGKKFLSLASSLKRTQGQKNIFFFYQREFRPEIPGNILSNMMTLYQDQPNIQARIQDLFQVYHRNVSIKPEPIMQAFADASILFNFIFMDKRPESSFGVTMREQSEDVFKILSQVAYASGGIVDSSTNPAKGFENATRASQRYYILYYSPVNFTKDGSFKKIEVKVKDKEKDYKIACKTGYYAR